MIDALKEFIESPIEHSIEKENFYIMIGKRGFVVSVEKKEINNSQTVNPECSDLIINYFFKFAEKNQLRESKKPSDIKYICCDNVIVSIQFSFQRINWIVLPKVKLSLGTRALEFISSGGTDGKSLSDITVYLHNNKPEIRADILKNLINTGQIEQKTVLGKSNHPCTYYYAIK